jgi:hypothetical protein
MDKFEHDTDSEIKDLMQKIVKNVIKIRNFQKEKLDIKNFLLIKGEINLRPSHSAFLKLKAVRDFDRKLIPDTLQIKNSVDSGTVVLENKTSSLKNSTKTGYSVATVLPSSLKSSNIPIENGDTVILPAQGDMTPEQAGERIVRILKKEMLRKRKSREKRENKLKESRDAAEARARERIATAGRQQEVYERDEMRKNAEENAVKSSSLSEHIKEKIPKVKRILEKVESEILNKTEEEILEEPEKMRVFYTTTCEYSLSQVVNLIIGNFKYFKLNIKEWDTESFLVHHINNLFPKSSSDYKILCTNYKSHFLLLQQIFTKIVESSQGRRIFKLQQIFNKDDVEKFLYELWNDVEVDNGEHKFKKYVLKTLYYYDEKIVNILVNAIISILNKPCVPQCPTNEKLEEKRLKNFKQSIEILGKIIHYTWERVDDKRPIMNNWKRQIDYSVPALFWVILEAYGNWPHLPPPPAEAAEHDAAAAKVQAMARGRAPTYNKKILMALASAAILGIDAYFALNSPEYELPPQPIETVKLWYDPGYAEIHHAGNNAGNNSGLLNLAADYAVGAFISFITYSAMNERAERHDISSLEMSSWKALRKVEQLRNVTLN